ncbi:MAG: glycosyltransferase family 39 protein [Elusimicrobia bacterium]|nr:glycosyltransferase family 39 protein [Elusimicrobiota bacterium]
MKPLKALALLLVLSAPFWDLGHPLWEVDDARYAEVPREMHESGDWLIPTLNQMTYIEKPPLIYWLGAASYRLFGVSEAAARLPLALEAAATLAAVFWLASWLYTAQTGAAAVLVLGSSLLFMGLSHLITPDMAVCAALSWAIALALRALHRPEDADWAAPGAWLAMGAAFLAKGLIGLVLPAAWLASVFVLFPALRRPALRLLRDRTAFVVAAALGAWLWRMEAAEPGFLRVFILEQHFQRFLDTGKYNRPGGWWFFAATDAWGFLPWAPAALAGLILPLVGWKKADPRDLQLALWPAVVILFFSTSSSKLVTYLLPALPLQALLTARVIKEGRLPRRAAQAALGLGAVLLLAAPAVYLILPEKLPGLSQAAASAAAWGLAALGTATVLASCGERAMPYAALAALAALGCGLAGARRAEALVSARPVSAELNARLALPSAEPVRLMAYDRYLQGVAFYTRRPVDLVNWVGELHYAKRFPKFSARFGDDNQTRLWPNDGERVLAVLPKSQLEWVTRTRGGPATVKDAAAVGNYVVLEFVRDRPLPRPSAGGPERAP